MWDGLAMLLILSTLMATASFLAGSLPLSFSLSPRQLRFISSLGAGVLVGTALIVIIPEGIETLYSTGKPHKHEQRSVRLSSFPIQARELHGIDAHRYTSRSTVLSDLSNPLASLRERDIQTVHIHRSPEGEDKGSPEPSAEKAPESHAKEEEEEHEHTSDPHVWVGISLILGFILLYLIDVIPTSMPTKKNAYRPMHISLSHLDRGLHHSPTPSITSASPYPGSAQPGARGIIPQRGSATTIGLIIHAMADGIALGASSSTPSSSLSLIIFVAIMLHKAPAAFGLTSILLKQGFTTRVARTHLIVFSLAAPAGALITWAIVNLLGRNRMGGDDGVAWATGCMLLFSGGTFLYVAMHSMQEISSSSHSPHNHNQDRDANGSNAWPDDEDHPRVKDVRKQTIGEIMVVVLGMLIPLVTQFGHHHH